MVTRSFGCTPRWSLEPIPHPQRTGRRLWRDGKNIVKETWWSHGRRPEWGDGTVDRAVSIKHEGRPAQRLIVRFAHRGRVSINTAIAELRRKESIAVPTTHTLDSPGSGLLGLTPGLSGGPPVVDLESLSELPESHGGSLFKPGV